jgi:ComEC/Rec2-related protein
MCGSPLLMLGASALLLSAACLFRRTTLWIYAACGLLAAVHGAINEMPAASRAALPVAEVTLSEQELIGTVEDEPHSSGAEGTVSFLFHTQAVRFGEKWIACDATVRAYLKNPNVPARPGELWKLRGRYAGYENPHGGADGYFSSSGPAAKKIKEAKPSLSGRCAAVRCRAAALLGLGVENFTEQTQLIQAMLLGYRRAISPDLYRTFTRTGTFHVFAISGQHVVILGAIFIAGLKIAGVARPRWGLLLLPALFLYIFTTGLQPSALRALAMATVFFAAPLAGRRPDAPSSIALAALLLLAARPANIGDPGFLLSFVVVCGLIMVGGWAVQRINGLRLTKWEAPLARCGGPHPASAFLRSIGFLLLTSLAAWLFSAPITARFFNTLSPAALIGNLAVIPLTFIIMLTGSLALLAGALFFPAAALFNQANVMFISLLVWIVRRLEELPGACLIVRAPSAIATGLWYIGLILFFTGPVRWRKGAALLLLSSCLAWSAPHLTACRDLRILREGDTAAAIWFPDRKQWALVTDGNPFGTTRTIRMLQKEGISNVEELVVLDGRSDPNAVQQLQIAFRPEKIRQVSRDEEMIWPAGVKLSP